MRELRRVLAPLAVLAVLAVPGALALAASAPTVTTAGATAVSTTGATANGTVNPNGVSTLYAFQWGPTTGYGHETSLSGAGSGAAAQAVSAPLAGLNPGTTYHYRIIASSSSGTAVGGDQSFTTSGTAPAPSTPPTAVTQGPSSVTPTSGTLHGTVNPSGQATTYVFEYGPTTEYGTQTSPVDAGSGTAGLAASATLNNLTPGATIHYRVVAYSAGGTTLGLDATLRTLAPPGVSTGDASGVGSDAATVSGSVNPLGHSTSYQFQYGTTTGYGINTPPAGIGSGTGDIGVHQTLTGLMSGTTYHYRVVATSSQGTSYGSDRTLKTTGGASSGSKIKVLAPTAFVSPSGILGVGIGCLGGTTSCTGTMTLTIGHTVYASRGLNLAAESGGFAHVQLSSASMRKLFAHYHHPVAIRLNITTTAGQRLSQVIHLVRWF
jgi:hypothetical protein